MKHLYPKCGASRSGIFLPLLFTFSLFTSFLTIQAQCPAGSVAPSPWQTYTNGQVVCVSTGFSGAGITLNNGAKLVIMSGVSFTGSVSAKNGSVIEVYSGATFAPSAMWDFAGSLLNYGNTSILSGSYATGGEIRNEASFVTNTFGNINGRLDVENEVCGSMTVTGNYNIAHNGMALSNDGRLDISGAMSTGTGTSINNAGRMYVSGNAAINGGLRNSGWAVFKGSANYLNPGDSVVNLHYMVFNSAITVDKPIRNEGLFWTTGNTTYINGPGTITQNNPHAQFRVQGNFSRTGNSSNFTGSFYVSGTAGNWSSMNGKNASNKLTVNKSMSNLGSNVVVDAALIGYDTTNFTNSYGGPLSCQATGSITPVTLTDFHAVEKSGQVFLSWETASEINHDHFVVEYARDGKQFEAIGKVKGHINRTGVSRYDFVHTSPASGKQAYRLRFVSISGEEAFSNVVMVNISNGKMETTLRAYPNPFVDRVLVNVTAGQSAAAQLVLTDLAGRTLRVQPVQLRSGKQTISMKDLSRLPSGMYHIVLQTSDRREIFQIMK